MNLLNKIKSIFNVDERGSDSKDDTNDVDIPSVGDGDTDAPESSNGNGSTADASNGTDSSNGVGAVDDEQLVEVEEAESTASSDTVTTGSDGGTSQLAAESASDDEAKASARPEQNGAQIAQTETESAGSETEAITEESTETEPETETESNGHTESGVPVDTIKGVGSTYAERLSDAGIETVDGLASADADALAEATDISAKRISRWIDRAEEH